MQKDPTVSITDLIKRIVQKESGYRDGPDKMKKQHVQARRPEHALLVYKFVRGRRKGQITYQALELWI